MPILLDKLPELYINYSVLFCVLGVGFACLQYIEKKENGITFWALSLFSNCIGFVLWSRIIPIDRIINYLLGEIFHITGFFLLILGAYKFTGKDVKLKEKIFCLIWITAWLISLFTYRNNQIIALVLLKILRSMLFIITGLILLNNKKVNKIMSIYVAGISLIIWGIYIVIFAFVTINYYLYYGLLTSFHVLAFLGMVAMVIGKMKMTVEKDEQLIERLEGILPICSYCKKIRDSENNWHILEEYIEDRSKAEFSHGICPDCFRKYNPDK
jgi:hypothetical protein